MFAQGLEISVIFVIQVMKVSYFSLIEFVYYW